MEIYPQDLGPQEGSVLQSRELRAYYFRSDRLPGWVWAVTTVGVVGIICSLGAREIVGNADGWLVLLCSGLVAGALVFIHRRRGVALTRGQGPLTTDEVRDLQYGVTDTLRRPYLDLVLAAITTPPPPDAETQASVREAIRALGESIVGLPPSVADTARDDPAALQARARQLVTDADAEGDPVVAASLRRRAEALARQAETAARTNTLLRRNEALRQEVAGQIAALQTSLTALRVGGTQAVYELAGVAASIQQVALEAEALTQARAEIGDTVSAQALTRG